VALATLADLRAEFSARGFNYLDDTGTTRQDQYINQAYLELCEEEPWPFLETTASGAAPLAIADLGSIASVVNSASNTVLFRSDRRTLLDAYNDLTTSGTPSWYYVTNGTTLNTYPVGGTLAVRYWKVPVELQAVGDVPVIPQRYRNLIVDGAARRAYQDKDNFQAADAVEAERMRGVERMRQTLLEQDRFQPDTVVGAHGADW
jgi:hypothetical protein